MVGAAELQPVTVLDRLRAGDDTDERRAAELEIESLAEMVLSLVFLLDRKSVV